MGNWVASRFNARTVRNNGDLVLYNSFTGAIGVANQDNDRTLIHDALHSGRITQDDISKYPVLQLLIDQGYFVEDDVNEFEKASKLHDYTWETEEILQLIIMPTEECNFRCVYCYEEFLRGSMSPPLVDGLKKFVSDRMPKLKHFTVSWFGGEPTEALDVIYELSDFFIELADFYGVEYKSGMTTNAYNITPDVFNTLITRCHVTSYQITVDGTREEHDKRRIKKDGKHTFFKIMDNLHAMTHTDFDFSIYIRSNFDSGNHSNMNYFLEELSQYVGTDSRFSLYFHPIDKWGGKNDDNLEICNSRDSQKIQNDLLMEAVKRGQSNGNKLIENLKPGGSVCYAARPWSLVVGSDGTIYKCTVALTDERNRVGRLKPTGDLVIDNEKFSKWVTGTEVGNTGCSSCFFLPSCQGAACPLERINTNETPCPSHKKSIRRVLDIIGETVSR